MTFILTYFNQLHLENIMVLVFSKLVSITLLLIFFVIFKKITTSLFEKAIAKSFSYSRQTEARKKPYLSSFTTP